MEVQETAAPKVIVTTTIKKFGPEWTPEQIASGEAVPYEVVTVTDDGDEC